MGYTLRRFPPVVRSTVIPRDRINVDTDQIVPKQFLKLVKKSGFGRYLFYNWRFLPGTAAEGEPNPDFVLNDPAYAGSKILLAGENFGCGSSREHAVWALADYGFDVIISTSFADIFSNNCFKNGVLPIVLAPGEITRIKSTTGDVEVNLERQTIRTPEYTVKFEIDPYKKKILLEGLDDIAVTLGDYGEQIASFERSFRIPSAI